MICFITRPIDSLIFATSLWKFILAAVGTMLDMTFPNPVNGLNIVLDA